MYILYTRNIFINLICIYTHTHIPYTPYIYSYSARRPWPYSAPRATGQQQPMRARAFERATFRRQNKRFNRLLYRREVSVYIYAYVVYVFDNMYIMYIICNMNMHLTHFSAFIMYLYCIPACTYHIF